MSEVFLFKTQAVTNGAGDEAAIKWATGRGYNLDGYYSPVILEDTLSALVTRVVFADLKTLGAGSTELGVIEANNVNGQFDALLQYGFGKDAYFMRVEDDAAIGTAQTLVTGRISHAYASDDTVQLVWQDRLQELDGFVQQGTFAEGYAGFADLLAELPDDIKNQKPPRASGKPRRIKPRWLFGRVFAWNHTKAGVPTSSESVDSALVGGVAWQQGTAHTSLSAFLAATPSQGYYDLYLPLSLIKLGGSLPANPLAYPLALNVTIAASTTDNAAPNQWQAWLEDAGVSSAAISTADMSDLNNDAAFECGIYAQGGERYREVLDRFAVSMFAVYAQDASGMYRIKQMKPPSGTPDAVARMAGHGVALKKTDAQLLSVSRDAFSGAGRTVPIKELAVEYDYNNTVHSDGDLDDAEASEEVKSYLRNAYRTTPAKSDAGMQTKYVNAREIEPLQTILNNEADALAVRDLAFAVWGYPRTTYSLGVWRDENSVAIEWGDLVQVYHDEYGLQDGELMRVYRVTQSANEDIELGAFA